MAVGGVYSTLQYSFLSSETCRDLESLKARIEARLLQQSTASTASDFIKLKIKENKAKIAYIGTFFRGLLDLREASGPDLNPLKEMSTTISAAYEERSVVQNELDALHEQKRTLVEDLEEEMLHHETTQEAYASVIYDKLRLSDKYLKPSTFDRNIFKNEAIGFLRAQKVNENGTEQRYCHITGRWWPSKLISVSRVVPKALGPVEVAYLFGVKKVLTADKRNALTLHLIIDIALQSGTIVIIPTTPKGAETRWKCVLVDQSKRDEDGGFGGTWGSIDGKELEFLSESRPAKRYLFLRYVITLLQQKMRNPNLPWTGYGWMSPRPYFNESMLKYLTNQVSDDNPPEEFQANTFTGRPRIHAGTPEKDENMASSLYRKLQEIEAERLRKEDDSDSDGYFSD